MFLKCTLNVLILFSSFLLPSASFLSPAVLEPLYLANNGSGSAGEAAALLNRFKWRIPQRRQLAWLPQCPIKWKPCAITFTCQDTEDCVGRRGN